MKNAKKSDDTRKKLPEIQELRHDTLAELSCSGCDANHKLIKQAFTVNERLQTVK